MYNTIEVMTVQIQKAEIRYQKKDSLHRGSFDGVCHTKVLPWLSVVESVKGSYDVRLGTNELATTGAHGFFVAPPEVRQTIVHHADPQTGSLHCRWIFLDVVINDTLRIDHIFDFPLILPPRESADMHALFDTLFATEDLFENYSIAYRIVGLLLRVATPKQRPKKSAVHAAVAHIMHHYADHLDVAELAKVAHMSPSHFHAAFREELGISPIAYLNQFRLSLAAQQLTETNDAIGVISDRVGIRDPLYFSKQFCKLYGVTPRTYRNAHRKNT